MSTVTFLDIDHLRRDCGPVEVSSSPDATSRGLMAGAVKG